jgi:gliding motility-associated-like protein
VIEKDTIQEQFSKAFENHTAPVRPELWSGVQSKLAAASMGSVVATKGISTLAKWLIGTAAAGTVGVVTTLMVVSNTSPIVKQTAPLSDHYNTEEETVSNPMAVQSNGKGVENVWDETNLDLSIFKDTTLFKPFCLFGKPLLQLANVDSTNQVTPVTSSIVDSEVNQPKLSADSAYVKRFPENTEEPVHAVLNAKLTKFPNFFSPNGDNQNDTYQLDFENKDQIVSFEFLVYNQKNEIVFKTDNPDFVWDGTNLYTSERINDGMYFCLVNIVDVYHVKIQDKQLIEVRTSTN